MKILILTTRMPYPLTGGMQLTLYTLAKYCKETGNSMDILFMGIKEQYERYQNNLEQVFENIYFIPFSPPAMAFNLLKGLFDRNMPLQTALLKNKKFARELKEIANQYDLIFFTNIRTTEYLPYAANVPVVLDMFDAISYNYKNAIKNMKGIKRWLYIIEQKRVLRYEREVVNRFKHVIIISERDKRWLKEQGANTENITTIPQMVRDDIQERKADYTKDENIICFLGKMTYLPNVDAVTWFAQNVFPMLRKNNRDLKFYIMGADPVEEVLDLAGIDGIQVTGFIENPYEIIKKSKVFVCPVRSGAGIQNKILESMVVGTPTVISPVSAGGLNGIAGKHYLVAQSAEEYVCAIQELLDSAQKRKEIGTVAQQFVNENFSKKTVWDKMVKVFNAAVNSGE